MVNNNTKRVLMHLLIWIALIIFVTVQLFMDNKEIRIDLYYRLVLHFFFFYVNYIVLVPVFLLKKRKVLYFISVLGLLCISYFVYTSILSPFDINPDFKLSQELRELRGRTGNRRIWLFRGVRSMPIVFTLMTIIVSTAIRMYEEWNNNDRKKKEIEAQKYLSNLEALKNQVNPHFLFNSLNSIYSLTAKKSNDAPEAVIMLSELLRYMLYQTNDEYVLLKLEMAYIENYIKLQRLRIAKNENVKINITGKISTQKIRPLLFISFIENAFKYGTDFKGSTEVKIDICIMDDELQFNCVNLIGHRTKDEKSSGIGMQNTRERLELLYPEKHWLSIKEEDNRFVVDLKLNLN